MTHKDKGYFYSIYLTGFGRRGASEVAAVRSDQLNLPQSFLVPYTDSGGIWEKGSNQEM